MSQTRHRTLPGALALGMALVAGGALVPAASAPAEALACQPPFHTLPGCDGSGADPGGSTGEGWTTESIAGMSVRLYVPSTPSARPEGRALMVNLHGCTQKAATLQSGGNWQSAADEYGMVVAIPDAPNGGVLLGCWDYYDKNHSRTNPARHDDNLLDLVGSLTGRDALGIDPDQVYVSGLSSGGGQSMVMGCLAPDIFAGVGINAGPTVGTTSSQIGSVSTSLAAGKDVCTTFAGSAAPDFQTQVTSVVYGNNDSIVAPGYNTLNGQIMASIYGAGSSHTTSLAGVPGSNTAGSATIYSDVDGPRVSVVQNTGLGHNWPAGGGPGGSYVSTNSINYPAYVTEFFFENNRRLASDPVDPTDPVDPDPTDPTDPGEPTDPDPGEPTDPTDPTEPTDPAEPEEPDASCTSASNAEHRAAGRASSYGVNPFNPYYATGSLDYLGLGDATVTSLEETAPGVFELVPGCG